MVYFIFFSFYIFIFLTNHMINSMSIPSMTIPSMTISSKNIQFRQPTQDDIDELIINFDNCSWIEDYTDAINDYNTDDMRILVFNGKIIGIFDFNNTGITFEGIEIYYVITECTRDKNKAIDDVYLTEDGKVVTFGRLLWSYILNEIYNLNGKNPFIIYNHAIPDAYYYHIKMGMKPANEINDIFENEIKNLFANDPALNDAQLPEHAIYSDEFNETYLFYVSTETINYDSIESIIKSLPESSKKIQDNDNHELSMVYHQGISTKIYDPKIYRTIRNVNEKSKKKRYEVFKSRRVIKGGYTKQITQQKTRRHKINKCKRRRHKTNKRKTRQNKTRRYK
jgi:hypothetical protein